MGERPPREGRTHDWRDCQHCGHYNSQGSSGGTPPWSVCQFWPRLHPETCSSYAYTHREWLTEGGVHWDFAEASDVPPRAPQVEGDKSREAKKDQPHPAKDEDR